MVGHYWSCFHYYYWVFALPVFVALLLSRVHGESGIHERTTESNGTTGTPIGKTVVDAPLNIIDGQPVVDLNRYPSFATPNGRIICGATLIWPDVLLSAAHCAGAFVPGATLVSIGSTLRSVSNAPQPPIQVKSILVHPLYDEGRNIYDIMLVFLQQTSAAPPATWNEDPQRPILGQSAMVIGYGVTDSGALSNVLNEAEVKIVSTQLCQWAYETQVVPAVTAYFCAKRGTGLAFFGDSGGPLFDISTTGTADQPSATTNVILGVVSFGRPGGRLAPNAYARVSTHSDWIWTNLCRSSIVPPNTTQCAKFNSTNQTLDSSLDAACTDKQRRSCRAWLGLLSGEAVYRTNFIPRRQCQTKCVIGGNRPLRRLLLRGWQCGSCGD